MFLVWGSQVTPAAWLERETRRGWGAMEPFGVSWGQNQGLCPAQGISWHRRDPGRQTCCSSVGRKLAKFGVLTPSPEEAGWCIPVSPEVQGHSPPNRTAGRPGVLKTKQNKQKTPHGSFPEIGSEGAWPPLGALCALPRQQALFYRLQALWHVVSPDWCLSCGGLPVRFPSLLAQWLPPPHPRPYPQPGCMNVTLEKMESEHS